MLRHLERSLRMAITIAVLAFLAYTIYKDGSLRPLISAFAQIATTLDGNAGVP